VIASDQNLVAAADAEEFLADFLGVRGILRAKGGRKNRDCRRKPERGNHGTARERTMARTSANGARPPRKE
jgi:hypothetical protein